MTYQRIVRFADTDAAGVVYFAHVLNFCHEAYEDALLGLGITLPKIPDYPHLALPIVHAEVDFWQPLACGDRLIIDLKPKQLDPAQFTIHYQICRPLDSKAAAQASTRHVCIDTQNRRRHPLPPVLNDWLQADI